MKKYLVRLDDACPTMNRTKWEEIVDFLSSHGISPLVGVIPDCKDSKQNFMPKEDESSFWERMRKWEKKGCVMAMHGYNHTYKSCTKSLNPINPWSEFSCRPYKEQANMVRAGYQMMIDAKLSVEWFFAPSHTFDENTLSALKTETPIRKISDTIALSPYYKEDFLFCPVQSGHFFRPPLSGTWTFCFHPSVMSEKEINYFKTFVLNNISNFIGFDNIKSKDRKSLMDILLSKVYFLFRKVRAFFLSFNPLIKLVFLTYNI